jgi:AcrR family transcriptional regulator
VTNNSDEIVSKSTRELILDEALHCFADRGYEGTSLNDIAAGVGIKRPSLLHHFPSKEALYTDVFEMLLSEWLEGLEAAMSSTTSGWDKAELVIRAGFDLFAQTPDYVRIMRREALDSGVHVGVDLSGFLRPLFDKACAYFSEQMELGHFRRHNSQHLIITGYGAILTYFSDAPFIDELLDDEALTPENVQDHCDHVVAFFRAALIS